MGVSAGVGARRLEPSPDALHRPHPIAVTIAVLGPARGEYARQALQRIDAYSAVVRESRQPGQVGRLAGLQIGGVDEGVADRLGLGEAEILGPVAGDGERLVPLRN